MSSVEELAARVSEECAAGWTLYVARDGREIIGMLAIDMVDHVLDQLFVAPVHRGEGVGTALLAVARPEMPESSRLRVASANGRAIDFYQRAGLAAVGSGSHPRSGTAANFLAWTPE